MTRFVLSQSSYGIKVNREPTAVLVGFGEIFNSEQGCTEDIDDKVAQMEKKIKLVLQLSIYVLRVH